MLSIQTNVNSLVAQQNLNVNNNFQSKTIEQLTSGYRINSSGDDAAGLAVANKYRDMVSELTQGVSNGNDGVASLQIMDGGISNIGQMLDRLKTLAMQSASDSFTGGATGRAQLNSEFQTDITEIDRQAQSIGLNTGGTFAKSLAVYLGAGTGSASQANSVVNVNLANSMVDSQALGLSGMQSSNAAVDMNTNLIQTIKANGTNQEATTGYAQFMLYGPNFGQAGQNGVAVNVNLSSVTDGASLVAAVNSAIATAAMSNTALAGANITASMVTSSATSTLGNQALTFTSANTAFQVRAGDQMGNALMGNVTVSSGLGTTLSSATATGAGSGINCAAGTTFTFTLAGGGLPSGSTPYTGFTYTSALAANQATLETAIINAANNDATLKAAGITATSDNGLSFVSANGTPVQVQVGGDTLNTLGFGNFVNATPATSVTAGSAYAADTDGPLAGTLTFDVSVGGGASSRITVATNALGAAGGDSEATLIGLINAQIALENGTSAWTKAGVTAKDNGGSIEFASSNGTQFQLGVGNDATQTGTAGFAATQDGTARSAGVTAYTGLTAGNATFVNEDSGGAYQLGTTAADGTTSATALAFAPIVYGNDQQVLTLSAADANGQNHSVLINLDADTAGSIDQAVNSINQQIHAGGDSTTQQIYAVAVQNSGAAQIEFESNVKDFSVNVGATTNGTGVGDPSTQQGTTLSSVKVGSGGAIDISTVSDAQAAVTAITNAVNVLGTAQAAVGKGENQLNYAISLAQSQITNFSSAESNIRDANVAQQAANLTKAQVLQQASIAAMAQANSAPQAILTLLRG